MPKDLPQRTARSLNNNAVGGGGKHRTCHRNCALRGRLCEAPRECITQAGNV